MDQVKVEDIFLGMLLSVVDILNEINCMLVLGVIEVKVLCEVFGVEVEGQVVDLGNCISCKKQIVLMLEKYFVFEV